MDPKRPRSRDKNVTSGVGGANRRGEGLGTGKVGSGSFSGKPSSGGGAKKAAFGGGGGLLILLACVIIPQLLGGNSSTNTGTSGGGSTSTGGGIGSLVGDMLAGGNSPSGFGFSNSDTASGGHNASDAGTVDTNVDKSAREKYTSIKGNGQDTVTIMVYMCGTDLESKYGMASSDMQEMAAADFGENVNVIVYTGGCSQWKTSGISNSVNQIYQVTKGGLKQLESDCGSKSMTSPDTLSGFIKYCAEKFPANRNELILWDHGGGSVSGYGYDEKNKSSGSMNLQNISKALKNGGIKFDFVGFDACLMATAETALMLDDFADYMIASEETEPGVGWYYTNWLTKLGSDTSMPTVQIGQNIIDDFVSTCAKQCKGQKTTLSIIDLAEFQNTVPDKLSKFADSISQKISKNDYQSVSDARFGAREFAQSSKIDQVDLVHLADNVGTQEAYELSAAIKSAVKYNRTSTNMRDAHGVSIYFPYKRTSYVDSACQTYSQIGMDDAYSQCIRSFAKLETTGQIAAGGTGSPLGSLFGEMSGSSGAGADIIGSLLTSFLSSGRGIEGLDRDNSQFMTGSGVSDGDASQYISMNFFDENALVWNADGGYHKMELPESQWKLVHSLDKNMFYDDGTGYIDLGIDNVYDFDDNGALIADTDRDWLAVNGQTVAYYHTDTHEFGEDKYSISGYIPAFLNGDRVNIIVEFTDENPNGTVVGASYDYENGGGETETVSKELTDINPGDTIDFVCDYYTYDGEYQDSYCLGEQLKVDGTLTLSNVEPGSGAVKIMYRFTDIYNEAHWSEPITK